MRVRITRAFVADWAVFNPGQELDVPDARGVELLKQGVAERVASVPETAVKPEREKAVTSRAR